MSNGSILREVSGQKGNERPKENNHEEWEASDPGGLPGLRNEDVQDIVNGLYRTVRKFSDGMPQVDDITAVLCKVEG